MRRDYRVYLRDILDAIVKIERYVASSSFEEFVKNELVVDAVVRNLEIIGEAVKRLPKNVTTEHNDIDWRRMAGLRDILIHEYFGVDSEILWDIIKNKLPELKEKVCQILQE